MTTVRDIDESTRDADFASLALTYQTVTNTPEPVCGVSDPRYVIDLDTLHVWPARCRRNKCEHCLPINARRRALAMTWMRPQRMIRLSLVAPAGASDPLGVARIRVKRCRQALTRLGVNPGQWCWTMEVNPAGTGYHAHVLQRGGYIDQRILQSAAQRAGAGIPYINVIRKTADRTARYGLKSFGAAGYGLKTFRAEQDSRQALELNHGRLEHHTPGFFQINDEKAGVRDVERQAIEELYPRGNTSYIVCDRKTAEYYLSPSGRNWRPRSANSWSELRDIRST